MKSCPRGLCRWGYQGIIYDPLVGLSGGGSWRRGARRSGAGVTEWRSLWVTRMFIWGAEVRAFTRILNLDQALNTNGHAGIVSQGCCLH